jgi:putative MATE family efflux protein
MADILAVETETLPPSDSLLGRGRKDLTHGPIAKSLLLFSLPLLGGNLLQSLNGGVNLFWVSRSLGVAAISAVGNANTILAIVMSGIFGVSIAANVMIGQAIGARDGVAVKRAMGSTTTVFVLFSIVLAVGAILLTPAVLSALRTPPEARGFATAYLNMMYVAMPFMGLFIFFQMAQRAAGDSHTPFAFLGLAVALDVVFNPILIRGVGPFPRLGIAGAATSTLLSQAVSLVAMVVWTYRRGSPLVLAGDDLKFLRPKLAIVRLLVFRGIPMGMQNFIASGSVLVVIGLVNGYGAATVAAFTAATQVWTYVQMPAVALGSSISTMAAQNIGAERWDRVDRLAVEGSLVAGAVTGLACAIVYLAGNQLLHLFLPAHSPALAIARHIDHIVLWSFIVFGVFFALSGIIRATGAALPMTVIIFLSMWVARVPFATVLRPWLQADAVWWSFPAGTVAALILTLLYFRFGQWRRVRMRA